VNFVRLFAARASDEFDVGMFNSGDYVKAVEQKILSETLSKILYPSDAIAAGRELRLLQEYFFVACAVRDIMRAFLRRGDDVHAFPSKVALQLNDTHPTLAIAELMRQLIDEQGLEWDAAFEITRASIAFTNHTLMPEALERWPMSMMERVIPRHLQIILEINQRFLDRTTEIWKDDPEKLRRTSIVDDQDGGEVRMAHLAIIGSHSINGVSELHSELIKTRLVPDFYELWPERFNNKTNGVTQRRWLLLANPGLANLLQQAIGDSWITGLDGLREIEQYAESEAFHAEFAAVKRANKERLCTTIHRLLKIDLDPASLFSVQAKRIHEYKRQLLMVLGILHQYLSLVDDHVEPPVARTYVMAGKAAPGYWAAKMTIKLVNCIADVINDDARTHGLIKVAFVPDYRVSLAERIIPAADLSEQISTAGREASGTGNMKFAMNGALTVGTLDGANIEIRDAVGAENMFIFGLTAAEIEEMTARNEYQPRIYYEGDQRLRRVLDELAADRFCPDDPGLFRWIRDSLLEHDPYFVLADFASYIETQNKIARQFGARRDWTNKAILNVARVGRFSSDRTIREYASDIWHLN
jgi:starch phosphorylase